MNAIETPPNQRRLQIAQRSPVNPNLPVAREDIPSDDHSPPQDKRAQSAESHRSIPFSTFPTILKRYFSRRTDSADHKMSVLSATMYTK